VLQNKSQVIGTWNYAWAAAGSHEGIMLQNKSQVIGTWNVMFDPATKRLLE